MSVVMPDERPVSFRLPVEQELVGRVAWLIRLRWGAAACTIALTWVAVLVLGIDLPAAALTLLGATIAAYNVVFWSLMQRYCGVPTTGVDSFKRLASAQFLVDWVALVLLMHLTGGIDSPVVFYFIFHAIIGSILMSPRATYLHATAGVVLVGALAVLEMLGAVPHVPVPQFQLPAFDRPVHVLGVFGFFATGIYMATYLASTISRRLHERTHELAVLKDDLELALERTRTLYEIAQAVTSTLDPAEVLDTIARRAAHAMGAKACSLRMLDPETGALDVVASWGLSADYLAKGRVDPEHGPIDHEVMRGRAVQLEDLAADPGGFQYPDEAVREGLRSVLCVPLSVRERPMGVLRAYGEAPHRFTPDEVGFLTALASQGSIAIQNARAFRQLEDLEREKSKFVFTVAHELKAPVGAVLSRLTALMEGYSGDLTDRQREVILKAMRRMHSLQELVGDLLALGALQGRLPDRPESEVDVHRVVRRVVEIEQVEAEQKGVELRVVATEEPASVRARPEDLDRLLSNLVGNAVKYTPAGGRVELSLQSLDSIVRIDVTDTGIGIPTESLAHIFDEFFRARNAKDQAIEGTGLGLALVRRIVELYRGEIRVESRVGEGSTFSVRFPAYSVRPSEPVWVSQSERRTPSK